MTKWLFGAVAVLFLCASASAQTFYSGYNDTGDAFANGHALMPPSVQHGGARSVAHLKVGVTADGVVINTNTLNVTLCNEVVVQVWSDNYDDDDGSFFVQRASDAAATDTTRILADVDGDGVISDSTCPTTVDPTTNDTGDCVPLDGDDGSDIDGDSTSRQTAALYGISEEYIRLEQIDNNETGSAFVKVLCR